MARPLRIEFAGAHYHLTGRGNRRERIFRDDRDRQRFLDLLGESLARYQARLHCFVLMPNHYHLLAETGAANLSRWMHWLTTAYTVYFNRRHRRVGHLFQGRYKSILVEADPYLLELSRYIHLNPVRGVVLGQGDVTERRRRLRQWRWSSYREYAGLVAPAPLVTDELILGALGGSPGRWRLAYRRFVEGGLLTAPASPLEEARWQAVLGSEDFVRKIRDRIRGWKERGREVAAIRQVQQAEVPEAVIKRVARCYGLNPKQLTAPGGRGEARSAAMALVWDRCGLSLKEIGALFGGLDYGAVAQRIRRFRLRDDAGKAPVRS